MKKISIIQQQQNAKLNFLQKKEIFRKFGKFSRKKKEHCKPKILFLRKNFKNLLFNYFQII